MQSAPNLILVGPMGAGKTSIGRRLADRLGLHFVDVDQLVVERAGADIPTLFEHVGEAGFREREHAALASALTGDGQVVSTGGGAVLGAENRRLMRERGFVVHLHVSVEGQLRRVGHDRNRPLLQRPDRERTLRELAAVREPLYAEVADLHHDTEGLSPGRATTELIERLAVHWQRGAIPSANTP